MKTVSDLLEDIRQLSSSVAQKGFLFEKLIKAALDQHPEYSDRFATVYLWKDWPHRDGADIGIDLVAQETAAYGGGLCAIQCKFYDSGLIPNAAIDKFLAAAGHQFSSRILIATNNYSKVAQRKLLNHKAAVITGNDLAGWIIDQSDFDLTRPDRLKLKQVKLQPKYHQAEALKKVGQWFRTEATKGRLLMPCGTGKSLTALWLAEKNVGPGGLVLYLVPSISLMNQTMKAWAGQKSLKHCYIGVCSDPKTGRPDNEDVDMTELSMPVTTDATKITAALKQTRAEALTVVFCTYQSLPKVCQAQSRANGRFDLIIADEAHRTTGVEKDKLTDRGQTVKGKKDQKSGNTFLLVHDQRRLLSKRRLYMTATQRIYESAAKIKAAGQKLDVYSMDDQNLYGPIIYEMKFAEAVNNNLLTDYRVVVIAYDANKAIETHNRYVIQSGADDIKTEDWVALIGLWDALASPETRGSIQDRPAGQIEGNHCRQGLVFTSNIKKSRTVAEHWPKITATMTGRTQIDDDQTDYLNLQVRHIDGKMNAFERHQGLTWLKSRPDRGNARIITNARCLSEGVDVPDLDAVLFTSAKKSKIDIIQSVGRVMRKSPNKNIGYIILPLVVPQDQIAYSHEHLNSSEFKAVWEVLRALRSHDERLDARVNSIHLVNEAPIIFIDRTKSAGQRAGVTVDNPQISLIPTEAIASAIVDNVGDRQYWPTWGKQVGQISQNLDDRISDLVTNNPKVETTYRKFAKEIEKTLQTKIEASYLSAMVAQHIVTAPVFDALFEDQFSAKNPISQAINNFLDQINRILKQDRALIIETEDLADFYKNIRRQISQIKNPLARLEILKYLYESFFQKAMPDVTSKLGVVYTPNEVVDFMIRFTNSICQDNFNKPAGISEKGVNILDPFTGTGTFVYRLLTINDDNENYLIRPDDLRRKFDHELQAKEILLLAYYIANLKIEEGFRQRTTMDTGYVEFKGATFTDTFKSSQSLQESLDFQYLKQNDRRLKAQNQIPIQIIISNPPWSSGQDSSHEKNPNIEYPELQKRIKETYVQKQKLVTGNPLGGNSMGNLYLKAIRWASDWVNENKSDQSAYGSIVAFVHPNSLTDGTSLAGARGCLMDEFTDIYAINLKGNAYKSGAEWKKEGDKIFESGSRNGTQITFLVKNPSRDISQPARLHYAEVPDYCSRQEKFDWLKEIEKISSDKFKIIKPDDKCNWINIGDGSYKKLLPVCSSKNNKKAITTDYAPGVTTGLDYYVYSFSRESLIKNIKRLIHTYNQALDKCENGQATLEEAIANHDPGAIKWTETLKDSLKQGHRLIFDQTKIRQVLYRPFVKMWLYVDYRILARMKIIPKMFPDDLKQQLITVTGGSNNGSSDSLMASDTIPDLANIGPGRGGAGTSPGDNHQQSDNNRDTQSFGHRQDPGSDSSGRQPGYQSDQQKDLTPPGGAILITANSNRTIFTVLSTQTAPDLCAIGTNQPTKAIIRWSSI